MSNTIIICEKCGKRMRVPSGAAGRKGKCPTCQSEFVVPTLNEDVAAPPRPVPVEYASPPAQIAISNPIAVRRSSSLGVASTILGIIALLICWIPLLGLLGTPLSGLGFVLGIIGIIVALNRKGAGIGLPIAGTAISGLALVIVTAWIGVATEMASSIASSVQKAQRLTTQKASTTAVGPVDFVEGKPIAISETDVYIDRIEVKTVSMKTVFGDKHETDEEYLVVRLRILNRNETKKLQYSSWAISGFSATSLDVSLKDNFGNEYAQVNVDIIGAEGSGSIYPGKERIDILAFEQPIEKTESLLLSLPARSVGGGSADSVTIRIPIAMVRH